MTKGVYIRTKPAWNKGTKGICKPNKTSFKKGQKQIYDSTGVILTQKHKNKISKALKKKCKNGYMPKNVGLKGELNPSWKGGTSFLPYSPEFNTQMKLFIKERDDDLCQVCFKKGKCVHHIDYDKLNSSPNNLILLCQSCHSKTNFNRDKWKRFFIK